MIVRLDHKLITGRRRTAQRQADPRRRRRRTGHGARGHRPAAGRNRRSVQVIGRGTGELEDRPTGGEGAVVGRLVGGRRPGHHGGRRVAGATRGIEGIRLRRQGEAMSGNRGVRHIAGLEVEAQPQVHTTEVDRLVHAAGVADHAVLAGFGGDVVAAGIGDLDLGTAEEADGIGLAGGELGVVGRTVADLAVGQADAAVVHGRRSHGDLGAGGVDGLLERVPAGHIAGHRIIVANRQVQLRLIAVVAVGPVGVGGIGRGTGLRTAEQVVAVGILAVHQPEDRLLDLPQLRGISLAISIGVGAADGRQADFAGRLHGVLNRGQGRFRLAERTFERTDITGVLGQRRALLAQLQQPRRAHRVIGGGVDLDHAAGLGTGLECRVVATLVVGSRGFVILGGGNAHESRLLKGC